RHTRFSRDWSSDVCSSDLSVLTLVQQRLEKGFDYQNREVALARKGSGPVVRSSNKLGDYLSPARSDGADGSAVVLKNVTKSFGKIGSASCRHRGETVRDGR